MEKVKDVISFLDSFAPVSSKMDFDNVGMLVGNREQTVCKAIAALDITDDVITEAVEKSCDLIISHHPLFFDIKNVTTDDLIGRKIITLIKNGISAICMHTNLDAAYGGVNDALAEKVGIASPQLLVCDGHYADGRKYGIGRYGELDTTRNVNEYIFFVKKSLGANGIRYVAPNKFVQKVAVIGGSGGSELKLAYNLGCDTFITSDVKYNVFLDAKELGVNIIDAGHFPTENVVIEPLVNKLSERFTDCTFVVSEVHAQPDQFA